VKTKPSFADVRMGAAHFSTPTISHQCLSPLDLTGRTVGIVQDDYAICTVWGLLLEWMSLKN
jgi:hypothetical protein